jgi:hypothetical protein
MFAYLTSQRTDAGPEPVPSYRTGGAEREEKIANRFPARNRTACEKGPFMSSLRLLALGLVMLTALLAGCATERTSRVDSQPSFTAEPGFNRLPAGPR